MTTNTVATPIDVQLEDGTWTEVRLVIPVLDDGLPGRPELLDDNDDVIVRFSTGGLSMRLLANLLEAGIGTVDSMNVMARPVETSIHEPSGMWQARAAWLTLRRIPDERTILNGRPFLDLTVKRYAFDREQGTQLLGVPAGMSLKAVRAWSKGNHWYQEPLPRLYRALLAAEREARTNALTGSSPEVPTTA